MNCTILVMHCNRGEGGGKYFVFLFVQRRNTKEFYGHRCKE